MKEKLRQKLVFLFRSSLGGLFKWKNIFWWNWVLRLWEFRAFLGWKKLRDWGRKFKKKIKILFLGNFWKGLLFWGNVLKKI